MTCDGGGALRALANNKSCLTKPIPSLSDLINKAKTCKSFNSSSYIRVVNSSKADDPIKKEDRDQRVMNANGKRVRACCDDGYDGGVIRVAKLLKIQQQPEQQAEQRHRRLPGKCKKQRPDIVIEVTVKLNFDDEF